jgi:hypothetical protein
VTGKIESSWGLVVRDWGKDKTIRRIDGFLMFYFFAED